MLLPLRSGRVKDAVMAIFLSLAMSVAPLPASAQEYEEAPAAEQAMVAETPTPSVTAGKVTYEGLTSAPPQVGAGAGHAANGRASARAPAKAAPAKGKVAITTADIGSVGRSAKAKKPKKSKAAKATPVDASSTEAPPIAAAAPVDALAAEAGAKNGDHVALSGGSAEADRVDADAGYYGQTGGSYVVQRGDTMAKVSAKVLGSSKRWREIARANPNINPNRLIPGQTLIIPGMPAAPAAAPMAMASADGMPMAVNAAPLGMPSMAIANQGTVMQTPPTMPMMGDIGQGSNSYDSAVGGPPPLPMVPAPYPGGSPMGVTAPPPVPEAPMMSAEGAMGGMVPPPPVSVAPAPMVATPLYQETKYRLPDELKPTDISPYFTNNSGMHGLFNTESALYPYDSTWHMGVNFQWSNYKYLWGQKNYISGTQWLLPVNLLYTGHKFMAGFSIPFQSYSMNAVNSGLSTDNYSSIQDPEIRAGYQIWKNYDSTHAVALHVAGKFSSDNYHSPNPDFAGHARTIPIGPTMATKGHWVEFGGAYTGKMSDRWTSHLNLAFANDSNDSLSRLNYGGALDYRVNHNFALTSELSGTYWRTGTDFLLLQPTTAAQRAVLNLNPGMYTQTAKNGSNTDLTLGMSLFNEHWQFVLGFPINLQSEFGVYRDFGIITGVNTRW